MTEQEEKVMSLLEQAHNEHVKLPVRHPDDQKDFCQMINRLQDMIAARQYWAEEKEKNKDAKP